eukprot:scaffold202128_cov35-Tisochrysis_lutea.AAC.2
MHGTNVIFKRQENSTRKAARASELSLKYSHSLCTWADQILLALTWGGDQAMSSRVRCIHTLKLVLCLLPVGVAGMHVSTRREILRDASVAALANSFLSYQCPAMASDDMLVKPLDGVPGDSFVSSSLSAPSAPPGPVASDFDVPFRGEPQPLAGFLGKATIVVNVKFDDPVTLDQLPGLQSLFSRFNKSGLNVLAFPTDQGWFEADDSNTLRLKFKSVYDFGQYPSAVVFDKADLLGGNALPLYTWLTRSMANPWGVNRLVFDYEKFLLGPDGRPLRRYPRKFAPQMMEADVEAILAGEALPPPSLALIKAWEDAKREAVKSEYAFKPGLNYYAFGSPAS